MAERRLLRVADAARYIGQEIPWTRTALADGTIPGGRKVRGRWIVAQADLDAWIDEGRPAREEPEDAQAYAPFPRRLSRTR